MSEINSKIKNITAKSNMSDYKNKKFSLQFESTRKKLFRIIRNWL